MTAKTPNCPECDQPPFLVLDGGKQAFCGNIHGCKVVSWNPTLTVEELAANVKEVNLDPGTAP